MMRNTLRTALERLHLPIEPPVQHDLDREDQDLGAEKEADEERAWAEHDDHEDDEDLKNPDAVFVTCSRGQKHTYYVRPGTPAAVTYSEGGYLGPDECPLCNLDRREQLLREAEMCGCQFGMGDELCRDECSYVKEAMAVPEGIHGLKWLPD